MKNNDANAPKTDDGAVYHLQLKKGEIPPYVILPGDPDRTHKIAKNWVSKKQLAFNREYKTIVGKYNGEKIATTSTGIGGPSSEIAIHELNTLGVHTCIRVGTTGALSDCVELGDLIIPVACVRKDGTSNTYIESEYPAFANTYVVLALMQACENLGYRYTLGLTYTVGSFYIGQGRPLGKKQSDFYPSNIDVLLKDLINAKITNIEMEAAAQFVIGYLHNMRMGAVLGVVSNRKNNKWENSFDVEERSGKVACEAILLLKKWDNDKKLNLQLSLK